MQFHPYNVLCDDVDTLLDGIGISQNLEMVSS